VRPGDISREGKGIVPSEKNGGVVEALIKRGHQILSEKRWDAESKFLEGSCRRALEKWITHLLHNLEKGFRTGFWRAPREREQTADISEKNGLSGGALATRARGQ